MDSKILVFKAHSAKSIVLNSNGVLRIGIRNCENLDMLAKTFKDLISKEALSLLLHPCIHEPWVFFLQDDAKGLVAYYVVAEVRQLLLKHGIDAIYRGNTREKIKKAGVWKDKNGQKIRHQELSKVIDNILYGRPAYWVKTIGGISKARLMVVIDELEKEPRFAKEIVNFDQLTKDDPSSEKVRVNRPTKWRYINEKLIQEFIDRQENIFVEESSLPILEDTSGDEYQNAYIWKERLFPKGISRAQSISYGRLFYHRLSDLPSFIMKKGNLQFRVYKKTDVKKVVDRILFKK